MEFTASSSFAYQFAKHEVLPLVDDMPEVTSGMPFRLKDLTFKVMDQKLTAEQLQMSVAQSDGENHHHKVTYPILVSHYCNQHSTICAFGQRKFQERNGTRL